MHKKLGMILTLLLCMGMVFSTPVYAKDDTETKEEEKTDKEEKGKKVYFASPMFNQGEKD